MVNQIALNSTWLFRIFSLIYGPVYVFAVALLMSENNRRPIWINAIVVSVGAVVLMFVFASLSLRVFNSSKERAKNFRISTIMLLMVLLAIYLAIGNQINEYAKAAKYYSIQSVVYGSFVFILATSFVLLKMLDSILAIGLEVFKVFIRRRERLDGHETQEFEA